MKYVSEIFLEKPQKWGLRGDPHFWDYLQKYYSDKRLPYSTNELESDICRLFQELTDKPLEKIENNIGYRVEMFAYTGGMSAGAICIEFWLDKGIPMLKNRLTDINNQV